MGNRSKFLVNNGKNYVRVLNHCHLPYLKKISNFLVLKWTQFCRALFRVFADEALTPGGDLEMSSFSSVVALLCLRIRPCLSFRRFHSAQPDGEIPLQNSSHHLLDEHCGLSYTFQKEEYRTTFWSR